jgi:NAD(P)-dependent dehydrogenase (short-subunit alcohol dehydrogenase family)
MPSGMVLTGCASGMGLHLAGALAARGERVLATDVDLAALEAHASAGGWGAKGVLLKKLDVRSAEEWEAALDVAETAWGGIDVVMNIAGVLRPGLIQNIRPEDVDLHMDVNVKGTALGIRAAAARMIPKKKGHIINFGSLASLAPVSGIALYTASKFAVRGLSLAAATDLRQHGVFVTLVMPDAVKTPMLDLQVHYDEAALTFSGDKALTVEDIERVIVEKVLPERPLEIAFPSARGALARLANTAPQIAQMIEPLLRKKGREEQERLREGGKRGDKR